MDKLLAPDGCAWDRKQTHNTLVKYLHEESGEVARAVRKKDWENLKEELGDVLFQVLFHSAVAERNGRFTISDVIKTITDKMIFRHPHVFGKKKKLSPREAILQWEEIKQKEKPGYKKRHRR